VAKNASQWPKKRVTVAKNALEADYLYGKPNQSGPFSTLGPQWPTHNSEAINSKSFKVSQGWLV
jgi:hypothetical protein